MVDVDVVVVSYNSRDVLRACVEPLVEASRIRVIVVDNASPDDSPEAVEGLPVTVIQQRENSGFASGCNAGWRAGSAPVVLFVNPDARIAPLDVYRLADVLRDDPGIGAVGPGIVDEKARLQPSQRRFPRPLSTFATAVYLHRVFPHTSWATEEISDPGAYVRATAVEWLSGACVAVPRRVLERLGGWDDGYFLYAEDIDLCRRIHDLGLSVRFEPAATAVHVGGMSAPRPGLVPVLAWSRVRYARKHSTPTRALLERAAIIVETGLRAISSPRGAETRRGNARAARMLLRPLSATSPRPMFARGDVADATASSHDS